MTHLKLSAAQIGLNEIDYYWTWILPWAHTWMAMSLRSLWLNPCDR